MAAIIIVFMVAVVVGVALYFTNVMCSWGVGNNCPTQAPAPVQTPVPAPYYSQASAPVQTPAPVPVPTPAPGTLCTGRLYKQCVTNNECQPGQKCESISINFLQTMACIWKKNMVI